MFKVNIYTVWQWFGTFKPKYKARSSGLEVNMLTSYGSEMVKSQAPAR